MNRQEILQKVNKIFRDVFDDETLHITDSTTSDDIEEWDSLEHINLVVMIEKCFSIKFTIDEVNGMKNVGEMLDVILKRIQI